MPYCTKCGNELTLDAKVCPHCGAPVTAQQATQPTPSYAAPFAPGIKLAFWGERFVAWLIDVIIISVVLGFTGVFSWVAGGPFSWWTAGPFWIPFFSIGSVIHFLYWLFMDGSYGQSLGKMIMRLKVVRLDGGKINMGQAAVESIGKAFLLPIDLIVGWFMYPRSRQRLFSHLSETVVVRESRS